MMTEFGGKGERQENRFEPHEKIWDEPSGLNVQAGSRPIFKRKEESKASHHPVYQNSSIPLRSVVK